MRLRQLPTSFARLAFTIFWNLSSEKSPSCIRSTSQRNESRHSAVDAVECRHGGQKGWEVNITSAHRKLL